MTHETPDAHGIDSVPFRGIVEQSVAGIYILQDEHFHYANATFGAMAGYSVEEMAGRPLRECVPPNYEAEVMDRYNKRISGEVKSMRFITQGLHRDGHVVYIEVHGEAMEYRGRPAIVGVGVNISAQVQRDAELRQSRQEYRELASHLNTIREQQRAEYAREVHDVLGGLLTSMKLDVGRISRRSRSRAIRGIASDLNALLVEAIDNVRELSESMRPQLLDHLGLHAAMASHLKRFCERSGLRMSMHPVEFDDLDLCRWRSIAVYRIFQEALTNVARHANATAVAVRLRRSDDAFWLEIEDNGCGMPLAMAMRDPSRFSLGLISMRERAHEIGGTLTIDSAPGAGTKVTLHAPITDNPLLYS
ncbi:PAS domain-containing sensor histidine kinase [Variovorax sp. J22R133]|uniref:PAS domain-containing sensor histidine kinase n=1 Tax=Variovorax brevis TaxID=3053503 RepID=UPI002574ABFC|nr:PAS domain-containing sensor histidine kinase [Variovorax sp. J22R133]MDM0117618.1 PAS domain-containing sensor histidine kinase [Variovorax sp. J22R133]